MVKQYYAPNALFDNSLIVFGYNLSDKYQSEPLQQMIALEKAKGTHVIIYQLEQLYENSPWLLVDTIMLLKLADEIWDYDLQNIEFLRERFGIIPKLRPMMHTMAIKTIPVVAPEKKDIDVLFYGNINPHREHMLSEIQKMIKPRKIVYVTNVWGKELDEYLSRAKIVLNLHYFPTVRQEQVRMFHPVCNGICVLSEYSQQNYMGKSILNVPTEHLDIACYELLNTGKWKIQAANAENSYKAMSERYWSKTIIK